MKQNKDFEYKEIFRFRELTTYGIYDIYIEFLYYEMLSCGKRRNTYKVSFNQYSENFGMFVDCKTTADEVKEKIAETLLLRRLTNQQLKARNKRKKKELKQI